MKKEGKTVKTVSKKTENTAKKITSSKKTVKTISQDKDSIIGNEIFKEIQPNRKKHISFNLRVGFLTFFFCVFLFSAVFLMMTSISFENAVSINYSEQSLLDYKVHLKPNKYYDTDVLPKNMVYVASLVDYIDAAYNYSFNIDDNVNMDFTYDIIALLNITDDNEEYNYLQKEYKLIENKKVQMDNSRHASISENIKIDYGYYNNIATGFKSTFGVNSKSYLQIILKVHKSNDDKTVTILNGNSIQQLKIPLSERSINIALDYDNINNNSVVIKEEDVVINNNKKMIAGAVCLLISIIIVLRVVKLFEYTSIKRNKFDKVINRILKTYDRLIVESRNLINFDDYQVIKVNRFEELLDVRDNLKLPINYYVITPHQKAIFYIVSTHVYTYTVKEVDLENQK